MTCGRAANVIRFIETLRQPDGATAGQPIVLQEWQREIIRAVYTRDANDRRIVRQALVSMGRKNGKTTLVAGLCLAHLCGPEAIRNGQLYSVAFDREQAAITFKLMAAMVRMDEEFSARLNIIESRKKIVDAVSGSVYTALSAETKSKHGFSTSFVVFDELAQFGADRTLYDVMMTSTGAHAGQALAWVISTQAADDLAVMSQLVDYGRRVQDGKATDPHFRAFIYEVPIENDAFDESVWRKANPALGTFRDMTEMRDFAAKAKEMPSQEASFRNLYLNQRIAAEEHLIAPSIWTGCGGEINEAAFSGRVIAGLDLAEKNDLTALVLTVLDGDGVMHIKPFFWVAGDGLRQRETRERVPFMTWRDKGFLEAKPGKIIDFEFVAAKLKELADDYAIDTVAFDRWGMDRFAAACERVGLPIWVDESNGKVGRGLRFIPFGQGFKDMGPALVALEDFLLEGRVRHGGHPVLTWNVLNAVAERNAAGARKPAKNRSIGRIDGLIALTMCAGLSHAKAVTPLKIEGEFILI